MRVSRFLVVAAATAALAACGSKMPGGGSVPGADKVPGGGNVPGGLGGASGAVDPNTCGNYAAEDAGMKLKAFLTAVKDLQTTTSETVKVVKQTCVMMGQELGMPPGDLEGDDTKGICAKVITQYQNNLKVSLKAGAHAKFVYKPGVCKVNANASASAGAGCSGAAAAGNGGGGASGECAAAAHAQASLHAECTPPQFTAEADAKVVVDKAKLEMTLKAMRDGLPKIFDAGARMKPVADSVAMVVKTAGDLKDMGPKFVESFKDQAMCITGQLAAAVNAAANVQVNVSVSVEVSASASGSVGG